MVWKQCFSKAAGAEQPHIIISLSVLMAPLGMGLSLGWPPLPQPSVLFPRFTMGWGIPADPLSHPALTPFPWQNIVMLDQYLALSHMSNSLALGREKFLVGTLKCSTWAVRLTGTLGNYISCCLVDSEAYQVPSRNQSLMISPGLSLGAFLMEWN